MDILQELPFLRRELHLPEATTIRVRLASEDGKSEIELDAPTNPHKIGHDTIPQPEWRVIDGNIGYLLLDDPSGNGCETIIRAMPKLRDTRGLILDLRDNTGGAGLDTLQLMAAYLISRDRPRRAVGEMVRWRGESPGINTAEVPADTKGLSAEGGRLVVAFQEGVKRKWQPPKGRATESRACLLARPEAEPNLSPYNAEQFPKTLPYTGPAVVLLSHRSFSAGELFIAGIKEAADATLVGSASTSGGGGSPKIFRLRHSGLDVDLAHFVFVRSDGTLIDGRGIEPDFVVEPDADYYLGKRGRMLEKALEVLKGKIDAGK